MSKRFLLVSVLFASIGSLSAMPTQQTERQVQDESNGVVMVGERKDCGPLRTSSGSLEGEKEYTPSSYNDFTDKNHNK